MMRWKLAELKAEAAMHGNRLTLADIASGCSSPGDEMHVSTVQRMYSGTAKGANFVTIDKILDYFEDLLGRELSANDLIERVRL